MSAIFLRIMPIKTLQVNAKNARFLAPKQLIYSVLCDLIDFLSKP
jgi:hypothetical protein